MYNAKRKIKGEFSMKKFGLLFALSMLLTTPAIAKNVQVEALSNFSTDNPPKYYSVKIIETIPTEKGIIPAGSVLEGKITVKDAARLKRDASFTFVPINLTLPDGTYIKVKKNYKGKYSKQIDKGEIAKTVALSAGNLMVQGFSTGYRAVEGAVKNEEGNRLKSSAVAVYESTPLSYIEKGDALEIKSGEYFYINFKSVDE